MHWLNDLIKRNKLSVRKTSDLPSLRAYSTDSNVFDNWFEQVKNIYNQYDFGSRPDDIWNCDESGFACSKGTTRIICKKGR